VSLTDLELLGPNHPPASGTPFPIPQSLGHRCAAAPVAVGLSQRHRILDLDLRDTRSTSPNTYCDIAQRAWKWGGRAGAQSPQP
jgi:hypothetical protein